MKKFLFILCSVFLLTGCTDKPVESSELTSDFSYNITDSGGVEIYSDSEFYQLLDVTIDDTFFDLESDNLVQFNDYNFDGYNDIEVEKALSANNAIFCYFRYNPDTEYFENWSELDKLYFGVKTDKENHTLLVHSKSSAVDAENTVYKWTEDVLVPVSREKRYMLDENIYMDYLEYDDGGNETLIKKEQLILNENGIIISDTIDVTPQ